MSEQDKLNFPGDFQCDFVFIINHLGESINITDTIVNLNIYENINRPFLTGDITFLDSNNLIRDNELNLGQERLSIQIRTSTFERPVVNAGQFNFRIIAVMEDEAFTSSRKIKLQFTSKEFVTDKQVRISKTYQKEFHLMVEDVLRNDSYMGTKKQIVLEPTRHIFKHCITDQHPIEFINTIRPLCQAKDRDNVGYLFYETLDNKFHFQSYGSMISEAKAQQTEVRQYTLNKTANAQYEGEDPNFGKLFNIERFEPMVNHNNITNLNEGLYGSKLVSFDIYTKTLKETEYNYFDRYGDIPHLDYTTEQKETTLNRHIPHSQTPDMKGNRISDYPDYVQYTTFHTTADETSKSYPESTVLQANSQRLAWNNQRVKIQVPGCAQIHAGEIIRLSIPDMTKSDSIVPKEDPIYSGTWLIEALQHSFVFGAPVKKHEMSFTCIRDSVESTLQIGENENEQQPEKLAYTTLTQ